MESYFFNAEPTTDLVSHPTGYDREYDADTQSAFFEPFFTTAGVFAGTDANACKVTATGESGAAGAVLRVGAGAAYVKGRMVRFDGTETVTVKVNCKIVARMNKTADVRAFQLLAVTELTQTEDVYDLALAVVALTPVLGGYEAVVTDTRTFIAFTGQPAYYPPDSQSLPYALWLYVLGLPMTEEQRAGVVGNPSLMAIFGGSLGTARRVTVPLSKWTGAGPWTQTVAVAGVTAWDNHLEVCPVDVTDGAARKLYEKAYGNLATEAITVEGGVTLTCRAGKPAINFEILVMGVR